MLYPSINLLRDKVDSKYTLVSMAAKRARDIIDGKPVLVTPNINKPVSIATEEIADDQITYSRSFSTEQEALELEHEQHMAAVGLDAFGAPLAMEADDLEYDGEEAADDLYEAEYEEEEEPAEE